MIKHFKINAKEHDALMRAARHGKDHPELSELDNVMCECAEMDLGKITHVFHRQPFAVVSFHDADAKIPAIERAWGLLMLESFGDKIFEANILPNFPKLDDEHCYD